MGTIKRQHQMPFGAELLTNGQVRFRLWAPAACRVDVCLENKDKTDGTAHIILHMNAEQDGWYHLTTDLAQAGTRYHFCINGDIQIPDPASRYQPRDVHGPSEVIDPGAWAWQDTAWHGRPWEEAIIYEIHVGSFTPQGNFEGIQKKLDYLADLGITALELMPIADFPGTRNWGYDGTYLFAPDHHYGKVEALKALIDSAHARGLMVFLDVVYNHFGPEGNYLHLYAPQFFSDRHQTPWGAAINYDGEHSHWVRQFFIHNALYWLEEYHLDGLRFDAVHAIADDNQPDILTELAETVRQVMADSRHIHLILENDHNVSRYLARDATHRPSWYVAQWNDDIHHSLHVLLTQEIDGYYMDYANEPIHHLGRCLAEGFAYQGDRSKYRKGQPRGEPSGHLPPTAFVSFLQNHDQVGNRAFGERINSLTSADQLRAALTILLLAPSPPLLFMGQEWNCKQPFPFFCDFNPDLAKQVVQGRRDEFAHFPQFRDMTARAKIPDPTAQQTFESAILDWQALKNPEHAYWLNLHHTLLALRQHKLIPWLSKLQGRQTKYMLLSDQVLRVDWVLSDGADLILLANLSNDTLTGFAPPDFPLLYATHAEAYKQSDTCPLPPWSVFWFLNENATSTKKFFEYPDLEK